MRPQVLDLFGRFPDDILPSERPDTDIEQYLVETNRTRETWNYEEGVAIIIFDRNGCVYHKLWLDIPMDHTPFERFCQWWGEWRKKSTTIPRGTGTPQPKGCGYKAGAM